MKKLIAVVTGVIVLCASCVSLQDREMTANENEQAQVLGQVVAEFDSWQIFHIIGEKGIKRKAYQELLKQARMQYEGNIEVRNITITGGGSGWETLNALLNAGGVAGGIATIVTSMGFPPLLPVAFSSFAISIAAGNTQKITAIGDVVLFGGRTGTPLGNTPAPSRNTGNTPVPGGNF